MGNLQDLKHCPHFEWIEAYIDRLEKGGVIRSGAITCDLGPDLGRAPSAALQNLGRAVPTRELIGDDKMKGELKKINK